MIIFKRGWLIIFHTISENVIPNISFNFLIENTKFRKMERTDFNVSEQIFGLTCFSKINFVR